MAMQRSESRLISLISIVSATGLLACSGSETPDAGITDTGVAADTGAAVDTGVTPDAGIGTDAGTPEDAGMMSCVVEEQVDTTPDPSCMGEWVATIGGRVENLEGMGIDDARAQVCIRNAANSLTCLRPTATCDGGKWEALVPEFVRCASSLVMHSFVVDRPYADTYCLSGVAGLGPRVSLPEPTKLYATTPVVTVPPLGDATMPRRLDFEGDLQIDIIPEMMFFGYEDLAAVRLPGDISPLPCFVSGTDNFDALYGFSPSINIGGAEGFAFKINATGLSEGTMVDLFVLGGLDCRLTEEVESIVDEAVWENYSTVAVAADGSISGNLPCFNWFAYKAQ